MQDHAVPLQGEKVISTFDPPHSTCTLLITNMVKIVGFQKATCRLSRQEMTDDLHAILCPIN